MARQNDSDDERGIKLYTWWCIKVINHKVILSKIARTSSRIMKTEVLMREPYIITMTTRLLNTVPIMHITSVTIK